MTGGCACTKAAGEQAPCACSPTPKRQGAGPVAREAARKVQRKAARKVEPPSHSVPSLAPPSVGATLASPGRPLDDAVRAHFESRFGAPFRDVRVHTDAAAGRSATDVDARAYTVANHVVFASGAYAPGTDAGRRLIAHELVHVLQQRPGVVPSHGVALRIDDSGEAAAVRGADAPSASISRSVAGREPVVQRQPTTAPPPATTAPPPATTATPLSKAQEREAIDYYFNGPHRYTPDVMRQIQARLGVPPTGVADSATVQAVAAFQQTQSTGIAPLQVDGKAASRTLARLFPSGLEAPGEATAYGQEVQTNVIDKWDKLTPDQRAQELIKLVNPHLVKAGIPPVTPNTTTALGGARGQFSAAEWEIEFDPSTLFTAAPSRDKATDLGETIYHEARHAEQYFRVAQMRSLALRTARTPAEDDRLATAISTELSIKLDVVRIAVKNDQSLSKMDSLIAEDWYQDLGPKNQDYGAVQTKVMAAKNACLAAQTTNQANPTPENQAALDRASANWVSARNAYYQESIENDAATAMRGVSPGVTHGAAGAPAGHDPADPCGTPVD